VGRSLSDERTGLSFTIAGGPYSAVFLGPVSRGTHDRILLSQIRYSPNLEAGSPYLYPSGREWPSCTLPVAFYDWQGYSRSGSNPTPHPGGPVFYHLTHKFEADRIQNTAHNSASTAPYIV
jgi:hypothetical protein